jgi:CSLREA domain-containing protein
MRELRSAVGSALWGGPLRRLLFGIGIVIGLGFVLAACQPPPGSLVLKVNTTADGHDAHPGDGVCAMTPGHRDCSLRAALEEANATTSGSTAVVVPAGRYQLSDGPLVSDPLGSSSSIDAAGKGASIVAQGASAGLEATGGNTIVSGIGVTGASDAGFQVSSGASLVITTGSSHGNGVGLSVAAGGSAAMGDTALSDNTGAGLAAEGSVDAVFTTITANGGGGITGSASPSLQGSIVANQTAGADCAGAVNTNGFNLDSDGTCGLGAFGDRSTANAHLGAISTGLVPWHEPRPGSPAVNAIPTGEGPCTPGPSFFDQRGQPRLIGSGCDIGSVEASFKPLTLVVNSTLDEHDGKPGDGRCSAVPDPFEAVTGSGPANVESVASTTCTLRAAIEEANAYPSTGDTIDVEVGSNTIDQFEPQELDITDAVTIHGNGAVFNASQNTLTSGLNVDAPSTIDTFTIENAFTHISGAGIAATAPLTLDHVTLQNNFAIDTHAGGILTSADLTIIDSTITNNHCTGPGSAILATGGTTTIVDSTISGNSGAADDDSPDPGDMVDAPVVEISGNTASISGTTISNNTALLEFPNGAAGLLLNTTTATVTNSTITGNQQFGLEAQDQTGGVGVVVRGGSAALVDDTISNNTGQQDIDTSLPTGPTIEAEGSLTFAGTILEAPLGLACMAPLSSSGGYNIVSDTSCGLTGTGDHQSTDALLGGLGDNGGPTQTQLPATGSPAIDAVPIGTAGLCDGTVTTDQRGTTRPTGPACDIGSVEQ